LSGLLRRWGPAGDYTWVSSWEHIEQGHIEQGKHGEHGEYELAFTAAFAAFLARPVMPLINELVGHAWGRKVGSIPASPLSDRLSGSFIIAKVPPAELPGVWELAFYALV
jgi:hypothetical protein